MAKEKGYDGGKKISGIKLHLGTDTLGLPHTIGISKASINDRKGAIEAIINNKNKLPMIKKVIADGGYSGQCFEIAVNYHLGDAEVEIVKRSKLSTFEVLPKRWIVERSFAWLEKCRRLWKNCERLTQSNLAFVKLAFIRLILNKS